jgi:hypothetical protein
MGVLVSSPQWYEEVFTRKGTRWLIIISNDANDWVPCFYIKVWDITANRKVHDYESFSEIVIHGNQMDKFGTNFLPTYIDFNSYSSDGICHKTMAGALAGLKELKGRL